jgi:hypothetical protein
MTLLWAIHVIEKEREQTGGKTPKLDAAAEVGQPCGELDELFRPRNITNMAERPEGVSYLSGGREMGKKSLEDWRSA